MQLSERKTSSDAGAFLLREVLDRSGLCERLDQHLTDSRDPARIRHSLSSQVRTLLIQRALGWDDLSDTQLLGQDPVLQLACSDQRSTTPLLQQRPSQATLSRLLNLLAQDSNRDALQECLLDLAMWRLSSLRDGKPLSSITLDIDGLPIETFGNQSGTAYNPYVGYRHYSPLVASIAETGDTATSPITPPKLFRTAVRLRGNDGLRGNDVVGGLHAVIAEFCYTVIPESFCRESTSVAVCANFLCAIFFA